MAKSRQIAALFLLTMLFLSAAPSFIFAAAAEEASADQNGDEAKTRLNKFALVIRSRKMLEIANRTATRIKYFIDKIYDNQSLIEELTNAGLIDDLEGNVSLFDDAKDLLKDALEAIELEDYEGAIANVTEAMKIFREVYRALHKITENYMVAMRNRVIALGLIVAMQRALQRIEQIERLVPEGDEETMSLLDEARQYLNITAAKEMLAEGNVTDVSHNLTEANHLINQAYKLLKKGARMRIWARMGRYLNNMESSCQKIMAKILLAKRRGVNVSAILEELGYQNETEFREALLNMIMTARGKVEDIKKALLELHKISQTFWRMDRALTRHLHQHEWKSHESHGGQGQSQQGQHQSQGHNQTQGKPGSSGREFGKGGSHGNRRGKP